MARETRVLTAGEALSPDLAPLWDALPEGRADLADIYDTHAWFAAWTAAVPAEEAGAARITAVFEGERPIAILPLVARAWSRWEALGLGFRPRWRPVVGWPHPDEDALGLLLDEALRRGAREFSFAALPSRDPLCDALQAALERAGLAVARTTGASECLAFVQDGWSGHRTRFKKFERTARNFAHKAERLAPVALRAYGGPGEAPLAEGFATYSAVHARGWKGELKAGTAKHRKALLEAAEARGWARVFVFEVGGVPAAAIIWFRLGEVLIAYSTVYDAQLAALSAGTVVMWQSLEQMFGAVPPRVVDLLPGHGPQKDQLGPDRSPLVTLEATRTRKVAGWAGPLARRAGEIADRAVRRAADLVTRREPEVQRSHPHVVPPGPAAGLVAEPCGTPAAGAEPAAAEKPAAASTGDARLDLLVAVAGGHSSPAAAAAGWDAGDRWLRVRRDDVPLALVRVGAPGATPLPVREIVLAPGAGATGEMLGHLLAAVANAEAVPVEADLPAADGGARPPIPVRTSPFPV